jgi:hypothetical protein
MRFKDSKHQKMQQAILTDTEREAFGRDGK